MPDARIVDASAVCFQSATALAPDADSRSVDVTPRLFAGVRVHPVDGSGEGGGVFAQVGGVEGRVVDGVGFRVNVYGPCGYCEGAIGGDFAEEGAEGRADWGCLLVVVVSEWALWVVSYWILLSFGCFYRG